MTADRWMKQRRTAVARGARLAGAAACLAMVAFAAAERSAVASVGAASRPSVPEDNPPPASCFEIAAGKGKGLDSADKAPQRGSSAELYGGSSADRYGGSSADKGGVAGPHGGREAGAANRGYKRAAGNKGAGNKGGGNKAGGKRDEEKLQDKDQEEED